MCCSTRLVKGIGGGDLDCFLVTRHWSCKDPEGKHKLTGEAKDIQETDPLMRQLFPAAVQQRFPFRQYQSANTGLTDAAALFYNAMSGNGVSTAYLTNSVNDIRMRSFAASAVEHAERKRSIDKASMLVKPEVGIHAHAAHAHAGVFRVLAILTCFLG